MATTETDLTEAWQEITTASAFTVQNVGNIDVEMVRKATLPAASERGLIIKPKHAIDDQTGTGNVYARRLGGTVLLMT